MAQICPGLGVFFVPLNVFPLQGRDRFFDSRCWSVMSTWELRQREMYRLVSGLVICLLLCAVQGLKRADGIRAGCSVCTYLEMFSGHRD